MTDKYAVFGNPIAHSKSPLIHAMFAEQLGIALDYDKRHIELGEFKQSVVGFFEQGGKGLNVTVPFKEEAFRLCDVLSPSAKLAGAVNTLSYTDQQIVGHNTDGLGLVADLRLRCGFDFVGKDILVLGAGGAVRGILGPVIEQQPKSITVANRTIEKAEKLQAIFADEFSIKTSEFGHLKHSYDLIVNGTSASLNNNLPPLIDQLVHPETVAYDMMYGADVTVFNQWADSLGALATYDGLGMLVGQAAEAFAIWRGVMPDTSEVISRIRQGL